LCRLLLDARTRDEKPFSQPFPQRIGGVNPVARIFFGRVCYFLRNRTLNPAEKDARNHAWKSCAKHVEKALIFCGFRLERLCKNLRITCEELVEYR
jgi:hypothetical protein